MPVATTKSIKIDFEDDAFENDIIVEARFAKNVNFSIRLAVNDRSEIKYLDETYGVRKGTDFDVTYAVRNIYSSLTYSAGVEIVPLKQGAIYD